MAKKLCWLGWLKRLFVSEAKTKEEKKPKRWRWVFGRFKFRQQPAITAPQRTLREATEEQRKHAINVAIATAAAAEAAVAAAQAAAEVVRLAGASKSNHHFNKGDRNLAAIKIQSAFRAYLARKALRALKGLVRLQAIVRGQAVRRQVVSSLKCLPSSAKIQSEVQEKCIPAADRTCSYIDRKHCLKAKEEVKEKETQHESSSERSWDCSTLSKEDIEAIWLRKQEAMIKRERMLRYSYSHQERKSPHMLLESVYNKESGRRSCRLEQWADTEGYGREGTKTLKTVYSNVATGVQSPAQLKLRELQKHDSLDVLNSPISLPRRSFCHTENNAAGDDSSILSSQGFPMYMAVTQSAKARSRSVSIPKQRVGFMDPQFENHMLYKDRISFWSSSNGESIITDIKSGNSQRTPI